MSIRVTSPVPFLLALVLVLAASPASAQGRRGVEKEKERQEEVRREERRREEDADRRPVLQRRGAAEVPRGWCQGRGNPHNTVENCGYASQNGSYRSSGSYEQQHADFHRYLDDRYRALAAERPLDIRRQLELRSQKSAEHERWHAQVGREHG